MIANFFNKSKPANIFNILILLFLYYLTATFFTDNYEFSFNFLFDKIIILLCLLLFVLIINFIIIKNSLTQDNSYAVLLIVFLLGTFFETMFDNRIVFANIGLLLGFRKIYSLRSGINTKQKLFDAGFWIGISTIIYSWSILYILLIYVGIVVFRKLSLKNILIPIIGVLTPVFIYFSYHFYFDTFEIFYNKFNIEYSFIFNLYNQKKLLIPLVFLVVSLLASTIILTPKIVLVSNKLKFLWSVLLNHLLISTVVVVMSPVKSGSEMLFLLFPAAIIITNLLQKSQSSIFKNLILYLFLIISIGVYML